MATPQLLGALGLEGFEERGWWILLVPLGVVLHPPPKVGAGILQGELCLPLQLLVGQRWVGGKVEHVSESPVNDLVWQIAANDVAEGLDHLKDCASATGAQVPGLDAGLVLAEVVEGGQMATREVEDVNVVANGSAVLGGIVCVVR